MDNRGYAIITGNGRSGTNWLESTLNASPLTHCRSEPYDISSSPFNRVPQVWKSGATAADIGQQWDDIIAWSRSHIGERDHGFEYPKRYVYPIVQRTRIAMLMAHGKTRRIVGVVHPSLRDGEWLMPWWIGNRRELEKAYATFKINVDHRILSWLLQNRPSAKVLHIIRHPCGRLHSWLTRFAAKRDASQILAETKQRLRKIGEADPLWMQKFGNIEHMGLVESEVWFWRYCNESAYAAGNGHTGYMRVIYEEMTQAPLATAKQVYGFCSLPWERQVESILSRELGESESKAIADSWKTKLSAEHIKTVDNIVRDSPMMAWWPAS